MVDNPDFRLYPRAAKVTVKQAANVLDLIEFFAAHRRPASPADIAKHLDWPRSSTFKLLATLAERGFLYEPRARQGYYPSPIWGTLVRQIDTAQPIPQQLHRLLERLVEATGETAVLAAASGTFAVFVDAVESPHAIRYTAPTGKLVPLHLTATGRALLSQMAPSDRAICLRKATFQRYTPTTLMSLEAVEEEIQRSAALGWFEGRAEFTPELGGVALPLQVGQRQFAVLVAGPVFRVQQRIEELAGIIRGAIDAVVAAGDA